MQDATCFGECEAPIEFFEWRVSDGVGKIENIEYSPAGSVNLEVDDFERARPEYTCGWDAGYRAYKRTSSINQD